MQIRGIVLQARKVVVTRRFGAEAWAGLYRDVATAHPRLREPVSQRTLLPLPTYLAFHDELMRRFFRDDDESHFLLGAESARWMMKEGPLSSFMDRQDAAALVAALPSLWQTFFVDGTSRCEAQLDGGDVRFKVVGLPEHHRYFEPFIVGYNKEILDMYCANPITATRIRGGSTSYHYLFHFVPSAGRADNDAVGPEQGRRAGQLLPFLSDREGEVLLLLAEGNTNDEIGAALGISGKTAQHHITRAYRKIGVSGRVGATAWLARHGLIGDAAGRGRR
jgi:DNA-binding CsgD family transcriptional regulator